MPTNFFNPTQPITKPLFFASGDPGAVVPLGTYKAATPTTGNPMNAINAAAYGNSPAGNQRPGLLSSMANWIDQQRTSGEEEFAPIMQKNAAQYGANQPSVPNPHPSPAADALVGTGSNVATAAPSSTDPLTYQQLTMQAVAPMMKGLANMNNQAGIEATLTNGGEFSAGVPSSLTTQIAKSLQASISDYQQGLNWMIATNSQQAPLEAELKGMESLISYPTSQSLFGQYGAPPGVEQSSFLQSLYATLNNMRNGGLPTTTTQSNANSNGYSSLGLGNLFSSLPQNGG